MKPFNENAVVPLYLYPTHPTQQAAGESVVNLFKKPLKMVKDSSITITVEPTLPTLPTFWDSTSLFFLLLLVLLVFCGNGVLWKVMEKSGKNARIFPQLTHNTWKSREKRPTFPHFNKTYSLRSLKCGKTRYLNLVPTGFPPKPNHTFRAAYLIVFFHIPTISGYFLFFKEYRPILRKKSKIGFSFSKFYGI